MEIIQIQEPTLRPCPHCNNIVLLVATVTFQNGKDDEGYRVGCNCGYCQQKIGCWYSNKNKLIKYWNSLMVDGEFMEMKGDGVVL